MNEHPRASVPKWFWLIAAIALLWNLMGCMILLSEVFAKEAMMESFSEEQKDWSRSTPVWIYIVFAISVGTGIAGSLCLLMRKSMAVLSYAISFIAVLVQMGYTMLIAGGLQVMGPSGAVMPAIVVTLAGAWLWFAVVFNGKNWLTALSDQ